MNYQKFHIDEETLRIYTPSGVRVLPHINFSTINQCIEHVDWLLHPFKKLNYNNIELMEVVEEENKESDRFSNWVDNEAETQLHTLNEDL